MLRGAFESHLVRFNPLAKQREYKDVFSIWSLDVARVAIVRNTTLAQHSARTKLDDFFSVSTGPRGAKYLPAPPYYRKESMATKALADLAESAMGASLMTGGVDGALHVARCLRITPRPIQSLGETACKPFYNELMRQGRQTEVGRATGLSTRPSKRKAQDDGSKHRKSKKPRANSSAKEGNRKRRPHFHR
ncbi:hypothetical protein CF319_g3879 [Tilletia indica]|nr:hypothetical protein CF319_g3879 [Tilletia indica]